MNWIYRIYNKETGKSYIGKTTKGIERINDHFYRYKYEKQSNNNKTLYFAMKKHGIEAFDYEVIYTTENPEELDSKEIEYIELYNSDINKGNGYNMTAGGKGGDTWKCLTPEERAIRITNQSNAQRGKMSKENRTKMSETLKKTRNDPEKSKKNAEVSSARMKLFNKSLQRKVKEVECVETGEKFLSTRIAAEHFHKTTGAMTAAILKQGKCAGFHFKYTGRVQCLAEANKNSTNSIQ